MYKIGGQSVLVLAIAIVAPLACFLDSEVSNRDAYVDEGETEYSEGASNSAEEEEDTEVDQSEEDNEQDEEEPEEEPAQDETPTPSPEPAAPVAGSCTFRGSTLGGLVYVIGRNTSAFEVPPHVPGVKVRMKEVTFENPFADLKVQWNSHFGGCGNFREVDDPEDATLFIELVR